MDWSMGNSYRCNLNIYEDYTFLPVEAGLVPAPGLVTASGLACPCAAGLGVPVLDFVPSLSSIVGAGLVSALDSVRPERCLPWTVSAFPSLKKKSPAWQKRFKIEQDYQKLARGLSQRLHPPGND
jgi:hypothetical protein